VSALGKGLQKFQRSLVDQNSSPCLELVLTENISSAAIFDRFQDLYKNVTFFRCSSAKKTIKIADKNDNAPILYSESVRFSIPENAAIGTIVGQILASDKDDEDLFGKLKYQFEKEMEDFGIEPESGEIFVNSELDFELKREYNVSNACSCKKI